MAEKTEQGHIHFLLVEDDIDHAELVKRAFELNRISNKLTHVLDGELALKYLRNEPPFEDADRPDLILLDLNLPKMSGHEVLEAIRSDDTFGNIPVVILSTSNSDSDLARAYESHANSYVVKPLDFDQFRKMTKDLGCYWSIWNHPPN
ncbi:MAG: response regulator [Phycisphaerales bacterium]